ncbi:MAG: hypothetical protein C0177_02235 [Fervidicoccus fontis]|nr:MAG: hypothetical protein C0177_02235 [Fervidicoccus fontis]
MNTRLISILAFFIITIVLVDIAILFIQYNSGRTTELSQLMENYQSLFSNYTNLNQSFIESLKKIQELTSELISMNSTYISTKSTYEQKIANLTQQLESLKSENQQLKNNLTYCTTIQQNLTLSQQLISALQGNLSKLKSDYDFLNQTYANLTENYQILNSTNAILTSTLSKLNSTITYVSNYSLLRGTITQNSYNFIDYNSPIIVKAVESIFGTNRENPYVALYRIYNFIKSNIKFNFDTPYLTISMDKNGSLIYKEDTFYLKFASEVYSTGLGDGKDEAILFAAMDEAFYLNYWGYAPKIYVVILNGTGIHGYKYHGFLLILYGNGKASLMDPAAAQLIGTDYTELVQAEPTGIYSAITSYISRLNSSIGTWNNVVGMIGTDSAYNLNNMDIVSFISFLYLIGG